MHALVARGAPVKYYRQKELDDFLRKNPAPQIDQPEEYTRAEWIPVEVYERMQRGTLQGMSASDIKQGLLEGTLPCGWLPGGKWASIQLRAQEHESARLRVQQQLEPFKQTLLSLEQRRHELERELQEINTQTEVLNASIQALQKDLLSTPDLSSLVDFAALVSPIELNLIGNLEAELAKKKKAFLASLTTDDVAQPKLSLWLNCMGVDAKGIAATRTLDLAEFSRKTKRKEYFTEAHGSGMSRNTMQDLLYWRAGPRGPIYWS